MLSSLEQFQSDPVISSFFEKGLNLDSGIGMFHKFNSSNATLPTMFFTFTTVTLVLAGFRPFPRQKRPKNDRQIGGVEAFLEGFNDINLSQMLAQHKVHLMTKKVEVWMCWGAGWTWWIDKLKLRFGHKISCKERLTVESLQFELDNVGLIFMMLCHFNNCMRSIQAILREEERLCFLEL